MCSLTIECVTKRHELLKVRVCVANIEFVCMCVRENNIVCVCVCVCVCTSELKRCTEMMCRSRSLRLYICVHVCVCAYVSVYTEKLKGVQR